MVVVVAVYIPFIVALTKDGDVPCQCVLPVIIPLVVVGSGRYAMTFVSST